MVWGQTAGPTELNRNSGLNIKTWSGNAKLGSRSPLLNAEIISSVQFLTVIRPCCFLVFFVECSDAEVDIAYEYGRNLGITFQIVDDILDVTSSSEQIGSFAAVFSLRFYSHECVVTVQSRDHTNLRSTIILLVRMFCVFPSMSFFILPLSLVRAHGENEQ